MSNEAKPGKLKRRDFLAMLGKLSVGAAFASAALACLRMVKPRVSPEPTRKFRVGSLDAFEVGDSKVFAEKNVVLRCSENGLAAISLECTHLGCIVGESDGKYLCPCHGSMFALDGKIMKGPAPTPLKWLEISNTPDGSLVIDAGKIVPRGTYYTL